jgi:hypothetical protein
MSDIGSSDFFGRPRTKRVFSSAVLAWDALKAHDQGICRRVETLCRVPPHALCCLNEFMAALKDVDCQCVLFSAWQSMTGKP